MDERQAESHISDAFDAGVEYDPDEIRAKGVQFAADTHRAMNRACRKPGRDVPANMRQAIHRARIAKKAERREREHQAHAHAEGMKDKARRTLLAEHERTGIPIHPHDAAKLGIPTKSRPQQRSLAMVDGDPVVRYHTTDGTITVTPAAALPKTTCCDHYHD